MESKKTSTKKPQQNTTKSLSEMCPSYEADRRQYASQLRELWLKMSQKEKALYRKFLLNNPDLDDPAVKLARHRYQVMREYYPVG
jgi:hypothetical protein